MTTYNSSLSVLMTYNTPSGTTKHCKSTEPGSHQTAKIFFFPSPFLFFFLFFRWAGSKVQYATKTAAFYTEQHVHQLIAFSQHWSLTSGSNRSQKHGLICDAIFSTCKHGYKAIITQDCWIRNTVSVHGARDRESWLGGWTDALSVTGFMLSSLPYFPAFCWSAILTSHIFNAFWSCMQYKMNHYSSILTD